MLEEIIAYKKGDLIISGYYEENYEPTIFSPIIIYYNNFKTNKLEKIEVLHINQHLLKIAYRLYTNPNSNIGYYYIKDVLFERVLKEDGDSFNWRDYEHIYFDVGEFMWKYLDFEYIGDEKKDYKKDKYTWSQQSWDLTKKEYEKLASLLTIEDLIYIMKLEKIYS